MSQMPDFILPRIPFSFPENIADGVVVKPINFSSYQAAPPFQTTIFHVMPNCATPLDQHRVEECWIVLKGRGLLEYEGKTHAISQHDILYFASLKQHRVFNQSSELLEILSIYW